MENKIQLFGPEILLEPFDINSCLSYSVYSEHAVMINEDFEAFAIGSNSGQQIMNSEQTNFLKWTKVSFEKDGTVIDRFLSVVCGECYTLYLAKSDSSFIILQYRDHPTQIIDDINPMFIYGGEETMATINNDKTVTLIESPTEYSVKKLPQETPIQIACLNSTFIVLTLSGRLFEGSLNNEFKPLKISTEKFVCISGSSSHCIAVTSSGNILVRGKNINGQLGCGQASKSVNKFICIEKFAEMKVIAAFAGADHSLFLDEFGYVYACGKNVNGQLIVSSNEKTIYEPVKTNVYGNACFCIAGRGVSAVFVSLKPPSRVPNRMSNSFFMTLQLKKQNEKKENEQKAKALEEKKQKKAAKNSKATNKIQKITSDEPNETKLIQENSVDDVKTDETKLIQKKSVDDVKSNETKLIQKKSVDDVKTDETKLIQKKSVDDVKSNETKLMQKNSGDKVRHNEEQKSVQKNAKSDANYKLDADNQIENCLKTLNDKIQNQTKLLNQFQKENKVILDKLDALLQSIDEFIPNK